MNTDQWLGLAVSVIVVIGTAIFWFYFWFKYLPKSAIQDYEPYDGSDEEVVGEILLSQSFKSGGAKLQRALYYYIEHVYWLVNDDQTGLKVPVLINRKKKQFKNAADQFEVKDRVKITGGYLKRKFDNDAAVQILTASDPVAEAADLPEKKTRPGLRFLGITTPYNPYRHPFGLGLKKDSIEKMQPTGIMLVAQEIKKVGQ